MNNMLKTFLIGLSVLTIIPVRFKRELTVEHMLNAAMAFPVVGVLIGAAGAGTVALLGLVFEPEISTVLMLLVMELITGGLHLDGLSDTFDAIASKAKIERRLDIMREGTAGPVGATAIFFTLGLKYLVLVSAANLSWYMYYGAIIFMPAIGRWAMLCGMLTGRPARKDGFGNLYVGSLGAGRMSVATLLIYAIMMGAGYAAYPMNPVVWAVFIAAALVAVFAYTLVVRWVANRRLGGLTGDVLGALGQTTEVLFVMLVLIWSKIYTL